jgi:hypothetical protein
VVEKRSSVKRENSSVTAEKSTSYKQSSEVKISRGDGKSADKLKKEMDGGKTIAERKGSVEAKKEVSAEYEQTLATTSAGELSHKAKVSASAKAGAKAGIKVTSNGVELNLGADLEARAGGEYTIRFRSKEFTINGEKVRVDFALNLSAEALARAKGTIDVAVAGGPPPKAVVRLGGEAFAGVQAGAELSTSLNWIKGDGKEVTLVKASVGAAVSAGIGARAGLDVGYEDGKVLLEGYAGVTLGLGASVKGKVEVNTKEGGEFIKKVGFDGIKDLAGDWAREVAAEATHAVVEGAKHGAIELAKEVGASRGNPGEAVARVLLGGAQGTLNRLQKPKT